MAEHQQMQVQDDKTPGFNPGGRSDRRKQKAVLLRKGEYSSWEQHKRLTVGLKIFDGHKLGGTGGDLGKWVL